MWVGSDVPPDDLDTECAKGADRVDERNNTVEACGVVSEIWVEKIAVLGLVLGSVRERVQATGQRCDGFG